MPRVLIVTSSYAPTAIADMHRARHLAWELPACGWEVEVLHPDQSFQRPEFTEPGTSWLFRADTPCHAAGPAAARVFNLAGMRSIGWRALWPVYRAGATLLESKRFDLVYITTAHFPMFALGAAWHGRHGVPYVLDYHDPWIRPDTGRHTTRGSVKRTVANLLASSMERRAVERAAGFVSVSPVYLDELRSRYGALPGLAPGRCAWIPFAGSPHDFAPASAGPPPAPVANAGPGLQTRPGPQPHTRHIVYIGAGGSIMARSFNAICQDLAAVRQREPGLVSNIRVDIYGTDGGWQEGGPRPLQDIAVRHGLGDIVDEQPRRVTYTRAMNLVAGSDGLFVLGVDDAGYVPSKLFTYALSNRPLLASLRADSPAVGVFNSVPALGHLMRFGTDPPPSTPDRQAEMSAFLAAVNAGERRDRQRDIAPFLAPAMAQRHAELFTRLTGLA